MRHPENMREIVSVMECLLMGQDKKNTVAETDAETVVILIILQAKVDSVMHLAISTPFKCHLAINISDNFHWLGLNAEVCNFCQSYPVCQEPSDSTAHHQCAVERIGMNLMEPSDQATPFMSK